MDVILFPAGIYPDAQVLVPEAPNQSLDEGGFDASQTVVTPAGSERWRLRMAFADLTGDERAEMAAFVVKMRISRNVFLVPHHTASQRGAWSGASVRVNSLNGRDLTLGGAATSVASFIRNGDFISVNSHLKMCTSDAGTNGSGVITFPVWPPFGVTPVSGALAWFGVNSAQGAFRMTRAVPINTSPPAYVSNLQIEAVEHINSSAVVDL